MYDKYICCNWLYGDGGLDEYIYKYNENNDDLCDLCDLCERYILVSMIKSDIFGYDGKLVKKHENDYGKKDVCWSDIVSFIIKNFHKKILLLRRWYL